MSKDTRRYRLSTLKFAESFFPARPRKLWLNARKTTWKQLNDFLKPGAPVASNPAYIRWLRKNSMLHDANRLASKYIGQGSMWRNPYGKPQPRKAIRQASVWYTAYPSSHISKPKQPILSSLANPDLWAAFSEIGIEGLHTGPMKLAGGVDGWQLTPSVDGHFDRISTKIDPMFGTERDYVNMANVAARFGSIIIDDIVPGHTGKGADFRLAEKAYKDYPGIYHMVEIKPEHWHLLPHVPKGTDAVNIPQETEAELKQLGYIIGKLQRVIFFEPGVKETNWSVTRPIRGVDGVKRRWVYLHYFKDGQPSLNWIDPTFAGMRLIIGDALHSLGELGSKGLRLDANGFLGVEQGSGNQPAWSEGHPLSEASNHFIASMVRKLDGFTFQELNLTFEDMKQMSHAGADLSYDFVNRPAYHHALATGNTEFLRLTLRSALEIGIDPASLVHALQNHDDLTYELVHFWTAHSDDEYNFRGQKLKGSDLRLLIQDEMRERLTGPHAPYNLRFTENGVACTSTSAIAAILGIKHLEQLHADDIERIKDAHLLLAMFNCLQPGVFALSGWDLMGSLTLNPEDIQDLLRDGDTRWINRGAYDLLGSNPEADSSMAGMPRAVSLYGDLLQQLQDPRSFANRLKAILAVRKRYGIATSQQLEILSNKRMELLGMVHQLESGDIQVTVLNFSNTQVTDTLNSEYFSADTEVLNMLSTSSYGTIDADRTLRVSLAPFEGLSLLLPVKQ